MATESKSRNLVYQVLADRRLVISCQNRSFPSDAEWDSWLAAVSNLEQKTKEFRLLVTTDGGHPTKAQLERLRAKNGSNPPTAIVSSSLAFRFMASAMTFINPKIRCFSPSEFEKALDHISITQSDREHAKEVAENLRRQLTVPSSTD